MRCMRCREEDSLVGRDVIRACCQWQPQLSKKRDFFPSMVPHEHVPYSLRNRDQGERTKTCPRLLSGPGHDRGTDPNRRATSHRSHLSLVPLTKLFPGRNDIPVYRHPTPTQDGLLPLTQRHPSSGSGSLWVIGSEVWQNTEPSFFTFHQTLT
jgi:hypothetical protein